MVRSSALSSGCVIAPASGAGFRARDTVFERDANGRVITVIGNAEDISRRVESERERKRFEAGVQQAQKLESLGVLAGGIAHDFNNVLASILGFAEIAQASLPPDSDAAEPVTQIRRGIESASELTDQMLAYAGKVRFDVRPMDLSAVIEDTSRLLQLSVSKRCRLDLDLDRSLPECRGDVGQLKQVIMNLIINASEALYGHGERVLVRTRSVVVGADEYLPKHDR